MEDLVTSVVPASPEVVWALVADVEGWPAINASYRSLRLTAGGPLQVGSEAAIKQRGLPRGRWRVTALEPGRSFTWESHNGGVTIVARHVVEPDPAGSKVTLGLALSGPLARLTHALYGRRTRRFLAMELDGFARTATAGTNPG